MTQPERPPLSVRQYRLLSYIKLHIDSHGWAPSYREMCDNVGLTSTSSVAHQLNALEARGYIRRADRSPRCIAVIE